MLLFYEDALCELLCTQSKLALVSGTEKHTKRQATPHDCLPSLIGDEDKEIEIVYGEEKEYFVLGRLEQPRQNKNCTGTTTQRTNQGRTPFIRSL